MLNLPTDLGERILLATRMAVAAHWQIKLEQLGDEIHTRQIGVDGGTSASLVTDDLLPPATHGGAGYVPRRPSRRFKRSLRRSQR